MPCCGPVTSSCKHGGHMMPGPRGPLLLCRPLHSRLQPPGPLPPPSQAPGCAHGFAEPAKLHAGGKPGRVEYSLFRKSIFWALGAGGAVKTPNSWAANLAPPPSWGRRDPPAPTLHPRTVGYGPTLLLTRVVPTQSPSVSVGEETGSSVECEQDPILVFQMRLWLVIRGGSGAAGQVDQAPIWGPLLPLQFLTGDQALL